MTPRPRPSDEELTDAIAHSFTRAVVSLGRAPYQYATTHALEEVRVVLDDETEATLILKDLESGEDGPGAKPSVVGDPRREIEVYRRLLARAGIGPRCHGARSDDDGHWLLLEKVPGVELWQCGRLQVWEAVAEWLGRFHERFAGCGQELAVRMPYLLVRDRADFDRWRERSRAALASADDPRAATLGPRLAAVPAWGSSMSDRWSLLHGELYPSNVLVGEGEPPAPVWPVDWEMAAVGPPAFDLAALLTGWDDGVRAAMVDRYRRQRSEPPPPAALDREIDVARLHLACQWLGWTPGWRAPAEHAYDWIGEALDAMERLGW